MAYCGGNADKGSTTVQLARDDMVVWSYSVNKARGQKNKQALAEAIAKHLKDDYFSKQPRAARWHQPGVCRAGCARCRCASRGRPRSCPESTASGLWLALAVGLDAQNLYAVQRVVDGDTVVLTEVGPVRLIGVDTPETKDPRKPVQYYGIEASAFLQSMLSGQSVRVESRPSAARQVSAHPRISVPERRHVR